MGLGLADILDVLLDNRKRRLCCRSIGCILFVKAQWGQLTDDHLDQIDGKRIELAGRIQETYGITKDEAEQQIRKFEADNQDERS